MGGFSAFMITVGVAVLILIAIFLFYYLGSLASSVYDVRVALRKEVETEIEATRNWVQKEMHQRSIWLRGEMEQALHKTARGLEERFDEKLADLSKELASIADNGSRNDVAASPSADRFQDEAAGSAKPSRNKAPEPNSATNRNKA